MSTHHMNHPYSRPAHPLAFFYRSGGRFPLSLARPVPRGSHHRRHRSRLPLPIARCPTEWQAATGVASQQAAASCRGPHLAGSRHAGDVRLCGSPAAAGRCSAKLVQGSKAGISNAVVDGCPAGHTIIHKAASTSSSNAPCKHACAPTCQPSALYAQGRCLCGATTCWTTRRSLDAGAPTASNQREAAEAVCCAASWIYCCD
jgi:hypothetical protein